MRCFKWPEREKPFLWQSTWMVSLQCELSCDASNDQNEKNLSYGQSTWIVSLQCGFKWPEQEKPFLQTEHLNGLSPVWTLMWCLRKPFLTTKHLKEFSPVWSFMWVFKFQEWEKPFWQTQHLKGASHESPHWRETCPDRGKPFAKTEHLNGFSPVWTLMWSFDFTEKTKAFLQMEHLFGLYHVWWRVRVTK